MLHDLIDMMGWVLYPALLIWRMSVHTSIRNARIEDSKTIQQIILHAWPDQTPSITLIKSCIVNPHHQTHVATTIDDDAVGFIDTFVTSGSQGLKRWEIDLMAVLPEYRGQGIARQLVHSITNCRPSTPVDMLRALTATHNTPIHRVMEVCGYTTDAIKHTLMVASSEVSDEFSSAPGYFIPVETMTYRGIWIESDFSEQSLLWGLYLANDQGLQIAGVIVPSTDTASIERARKLDFQIIGAFYWYTKTP